MKKIIAKKGYTITVKSWENDGDNNQIHSKTVDNLDEAKRIKKICLELFKSSGIGNSIESYICKHTISDYIEQNPELNLTTRDIDMINDELLGFSEFYAYRVCESAEITYLEEDIYAEVID